MADSLWGLLSGKYAAHAEERAFGQRHGYRMQWFTYRQVVAMAAWVQGQLEDRGIGKGERVMLWGKNCAEWVAAFFASAASGVLVVPMDNAASADFAGRVAQQVDAKLWICSRDHIGDAAGANARLLLEDLSEHANGRAAQMREVAIGRDDILQIVFTSGTTAEPKGVVITHGNVLANVAPLEREIEKYLRYERWVHPIRFLNTLPLSHVFGQFMGMFLPPLLGGSTMFQNDFGPSEITSTIQRERVSVLVTVPRVAQSLKQKIERDFAADGTSDKFQRDFCASAGQHFLRRWWRFRAIHRQFGWKFWAVICGGAALDTETEEFWQRLGYAAIQGYGLTETTSLISVNHPFKVGKGSIGKVLPGRSVKLAENGEILIRGDGVASGYWDVSGQISAADAAGWYHTGDIGALDEEGNLYFKGRKKEVIVTPGGLNIYPEDLEAAIRKHAEVKDCVVVGIERGSNAEPCAVVIASDDASAATAVQRANASLAEFQRMQMWTRWPEEDFPRTSTQKIKKSLIAKYAAEKILGAGHTSVVGQNSIAELIGRIAGRNIAALDQNTSLESGLGLSSLDRVELISALEDRYQVDLGDGMLISAKTIGDIEKMLSRGEVQARQQYHYPAWTLRWPATWARWLAHYLLMRPAMLLLGWPRIDGRENLQGVSGPLLVVCNHIEHVDVGFVQTALPTKWRHRIVTAAGGEALEALRTPPTGRGFIFRIYDRLQWVLGVSLLNLFPLPRQAGFRRSFAYAAQAVDRGYSVLVFPEGRHTSDGTINPFRSGIGLLAKNLNIPVLPMRIAGLFEVKNAGKRFAGWKKISVRIGRPITFAGECDPDQIARELQQAVDAL